MRKSFVILIISLLITHTFFGQNTYNVNLIPDSLSKNADAVIRFYNTSYKIVSNEKYITNIHYAITILNPDGKYFSTLIALYDRNSDISNIKGYIYNSKGELQNTLKKKNIGDNAANGSYSMFSDNRVKYFNPSVSSYPFTVEYEYTIENSSTVGFDTWMPQKWFNISVESAELSFNTYDESSFKYIELNHDFIKNISHTDNSYNCTWKVKNLKAIEDEPHSPNYLDFMPAVLLSPNKIICEKTEGDFLTWQNYGSWIYSLINNRDELSEETVNYITNLTDTIDNKIDKIKAIYKYMQNKTRYVSVALGIGGFQPMLATEVDAKGYGDCKALSNYTMALLKCIGITSYYTEIGTGEYQEIKFTDFASANQTNHIILCVPMDTDTVWLECTNQNIPFDFLPPSSQNRYALLIKPNGGVLVKTPSYSANANIRTSNIDLKINAIGEVDFKITTDYYNSLFAEIFPLLNISHKEQKEYLLKNLSSSNNIEIAKMSIADNSMDTAKGNLYVEGKLNNFASIVGSRIFFSPEFFFNNEFLSFIPSERELEVFEPISYSYSDTLRISYPKDYSIDFLQNSMQFSSVYGQYNFIVEHFDNSITIIRNLSINEGKYDCTSFDEINKFLKRVSYCENKKIIIIKE